jgi:hypothetical protein
LTAAARQAFHFPLFSFPFNLPAPMLPNRIVARFADGRMLKGTTQDFAPMKDTFHVIGSEGGAQPVQVSVSDLKAVFFVKSLIGNAAYHEVKEFGAPAPGRKVQVTFNDGEVLVGSTQGYQPDRPGFFMGPADPQSNNERVYVVAKAVEKVSFLS